MFLMGKKTPTYSLLEMKKERLFRITERFLSERDSYVLGKAENIASLGEDLKRAMREFLQNKTNGLILNAEKLNALSPLSVMSRGFAYTTVNSRIIKSVKDTKVGDDIKINFKDGAINAKVALVEENI